MERVSFELHVNSVRERKRTECVTSKRCYCEEEHNNGKEERGRRLLKTVNQTPV